MLIVVAGCGTAGTAETFDPATAPTKTMFAVAQIVEARAVKAVGAYRRGAPLDTVCERQVNTTSWACMSLYVPSSGLVDSYTQIGSSATVSYDRTRRVFTLARAGARVNDILPLAEVARVVGEDGDQTTVNTQAYSLTTITGDRQAVSVSTLGAARHLMHQDPRVAIDS